MILEASALREAKAILETPDLLVLKETKEIKALAVHKSHRGIRVALSVMSEHRDHRVVHRVAKAILETPGLPVLKETKENKALAVHKVHRGIRVALSVMSEHRDHRVGHRVVVLDVLVDRDRVLEAWPTWGTERW